MGTYLLSASAHSIGGNWVSEEAWNSCLRELRKKVLSQSYQTWLEPLRCTRFDSDKIVLETPHSFAVSWVEENYLDHIRKVVRHLYKTEPEVTVCVSPGSDLEDEQISFWQSTSAGGSGHRQPNEVAVPVGAGVETQVQSGHSNAPTSYDAAPTPAFSEPTVQPQSPPRQTTATRSAPKYRTPSPARTTNATCAPDSGMGTPFSLKPEFTFDSFVVGQYNQMAYIAAQNVAVDPGTPACNPLLVYGGVGLGKTHLLHAVAHATLAADPSRRVMYVTSEQFVQDFVGSLKEGKTLQFARRYRQVDVLLLDDIQFFQGKEGMQEEFFHTFNTLHTQGKQIVLSSDRNPEALGQMQDRLLSRIQWGLVADVQIPNVETRAAICQKKAERSGLTLNLEQAHYIAEQLNSNVREIEQVVNKLILQTQAMKMQLSMDLVEQAVGKKKVEVARKISVMKIRDIVSEKYGLPQKALLGRSRRADLVARRQMAMYFSKKFTDDSLRSIGKNFGGRNHATVLHSVRAFDKRLKADSQLRREANEVAEELGLPPLFPDVAA